MEVALNSDLLTSVLALSLSIYVLKELAMGAAAAHVSHSRHMPHPDVNPVTSKIFSEASLA